MNIRLKVSFYLYILICIFGMAGGIVYLSVPTMMPYHLQALGIPWNDLAEGVRALLWVMVKVIGGLSVIIGAVMLVLVLIPFRNKEPWARYAVFGGGFAANAFMLGATVVVRSMTGAHTPIAMMAASTGVVIAAFLLSLDFGKG
jgi:hypothetical protein